MSFDDSEFLFIFIFVGFHINITTKLHSLYRFFTYVLGIINSARLAILLLLCFFLYLFESSVLSDGRFFVEFTPPLITYRIYSLPRILNFLRRPFFEAASLKQRVFTSDALVSTTRKVRFFARLSLSYGAFNVEDVTHDLAHFW